MYLKDFLKRSVIKALVIVLIAWLIGPYSPLPFPDPPEEIGAVMLDSHTHGSGSYHDPYELRLRI